MKIFLLRLFFVSAIFAFLVFLDVNLYSSSTGITGLTKRDGSIGCICHGNHKPMPQVSVFFTGPDSVAISQTVIYKIKLSHGPAIKGGFNVASFAGVIDTVAADTTIRRQNGELTHRFPKPFVNDTVYWTFKYTAPLTPQIDTLYAVANSTNNDGMPDTSDQWNFSENFPVRVYIPIGIINNGTIVDNFRLEQNYPNPFNSTSKIKYQIAKRSYVILKVFDIRGKEVMMLVNKFQQPGNYEVDFEGTNLASGTYFYQLVINNEQLTVEYRDTKRMILLK